MNKSISISLGGLSFFIEEDAYRKLQEYLDDVKEFLKSEEDTDEILRDVETRIAELFKEWLGNYRQVVDEKDVDKMIGIMGTPEQYQTESAEDDSKEQTQYQQGKAKEGKFYQRQLYRDVNDKIIAGVCSGLAHFFGVQPIWFRLGVVLSFILLNWVSDGIASSIFIAYIVFWIVMPKAVTTSDKLKMKGKPVNVDSIKEYVNKEELSEQAGRVKKNITKASSGLGDFLESFFKVLIKIIAIGTGIVLLLVGGAFLISYLTVIVSLSLPNVNTMQYAGLVVDSTWQLYTLVILIGVVVIIASLFLILVGLRLITEKKIVKITLAASISIFAIWLISAIVVLVMTFSIIASQFGNTVEQSNKFMIPSTSDTLKVSINDNMGGDIYNSNKRVRIGVNTDKIFFTKEGIIKKIDREIELRQSPDSNYYLEVKSFSSGKDELEARDNISYINYQYKTEGNGVNLNSYLLIPEKTKFRNQDVELILYVPKGKYIETKNIRKVSNKENGEYTIFRNNDGNSNKVFKFVNNSLKCLTCDDFEGFSIGDDTGSVNINKDGIFLGDSTGSISINKDGIHIVDPSRRNVEKNNSEQGIKIKNHGTDSL